MSKPTTHGTHSAYADGCRCGPCTVANTLYYREYRKANAERLRARSKAIRATPEFRAKWAKYVAANRNKKRARSAVKAAIKKGTLTRPANCACGSDALVEAHHHDYTKPLEVEWLCRRCHRKHHETPHDWRKRAA